MYGDASVLSSLPPTHVFVANINRNIILRDMKTYAEKLIQGGTLLLSGFYRQDRNQIMKEATKAGLTLVEVRTKNDWLGMKFVQ